MTKNVLITGANAGLGLETARQLALRSDYGQIFVSARTQDKADKAVASLVERTGTPADRFTSVLFDLLDTDSVERAVDELAVGGVHLDAIVLNAGGLSLLVDGRLAPAPSGNTRLFEMNVGGHARLVNGLLERGVLASDGTVVFAATEGVRGVPRMGMKTPVLPEGELDAVLASVARGEHVSGKADPTYEYALVKLVGTAWMSHLAERRGLRALAVSPGATAGTNAGNNVSLGMRVMWELTMPLMKLFGVAHGVDAGAARYVQALDDSSMIAGTFYASADARMSGPLVAQTTEQQPLLGDADFIAACGRLLGGSGETSPNVAS